MLWSSTLLKGGQYPLVSNRTPLPWEGRTKDVIQVLSISTHDYLRSTCLHYIYELELVPYRPWLWWLYDEYHPMNSPIKCLRVSPILFLLSYYCCCCCYNHYKTATITVTTVTVTTAIKLSYWCATDHLAADLCSPHLEINYLQQSDQWQSSMIFLIIVTAVIVMVMVIAVIL